MPTRRGRGASDLLRGSIRPGRSRTTASQAGSRVRRRSERRTMLRRAALVAVLLGSFVGSAVLLSRERGPSNIGRDAGVP